jgi:hypothetical protein
MTINDTDAAAGMAWWNSATEKERAYWLEKAHSARPADAWTAFKAQDDPQPDDYPSI